MNSENTKKQWQINKTKYNTKYEKSNYKQFKVDIKTEDAEEYKKLLKEHNLTFTQLVRNAFEDLKKK